MSIWLGKLFSSPCLVTRGHNGSSYLAIHQFKVAFENSREAPYWKTCFILSHNFCSCYVHNLFHEFSHTLHAKFIDSQDCWTQHREPKLPINLLSLIPPSGYLFEQCFLMIMCIMTWNISIKSTCTSGMFDKFLSMGSIILEISVLHHPSHTLSKEFVQSMIAYKVLTQCSLESKS